MNLRRLRDYAWVLLALGLPTPRSALAAPTTEGLKPGPAGIVDVVRGNRVSAPFLDLADDPGWKNPEVKGFILRTEWMAVEPAEGKFDFSFFDQAVELARQNGKFVGLSICAGRASPDWVYADGAAKMTFTRRLTMGDPTRNSMPWPWDPVFRAKWRSLIRQFAKRYDLTPEVAYIVMTGPGRDFETYVASRPDEIADFTQAGGLAAWSQAAEGIADDYVEAFAHTPLVYGMGPPTPTSEGRATVVDVMGRLFRKYPYQFGVCCDSLAPRFNPQTPSAAFVKSESAHATVGFQMLLPSKHGLNMHGGALGDALKTGVADGAHYIEVYSIDCADPDQQGNLAAANTGLAANAANARPH